MHCDCVPMRACCVAVLLAVTATAHPATAYVRDGKLVVEARDTAVSVIADDLTAATSIPVIVAPEVGEVRVSTTAEGPVDSVIRKALVDFDVFLFYSPDASNRSALQLVWVYPKGRGRSIRPTPKEEWASTKEIEAQLADDDPGVRARAYETLIERKRAHATDLVVECLRRDRDKTVRARVLHSALRRGVIIPSTILSSLVASDSSEIVRLLSLEALQSQPLIGQIASNALNDPDPAVRQKAQEILDGLSSESSSADGAAALR